MPVIFQARIQPEADFCYLCPFPGVLDFEAAANSGSAASPIPCPPFVPSSPSLINHSFQSSSINHPSMRPSSRGLAILPAPESSSSARDAALLPRRLVKRQEPIVQGLESLDRQNAPPHTKSRPSSSGQPQTSKTKSSRLHRCIGSIAIIARPSCARLTRQLISARHFPLPALARSARDVIGARHRSGFHQLSIAHLAIAWPDAPCRTRRANRRPRTVRASPPKAPALPTTPRQDPRQR